MTDTSIVIVNYNGERYLDDCLGSLQRMRVRGEPPEIILVDNGSMDSSIEVAKKHPDVKILENEENNYCSANNLGIKEAKGRKYVILLNNDTEVDKNWLIELIKAAESDERAGCVASKLLYHDRRDTIQGLGLEPLPDFYWIDSCIGKKESECDHLKEAFEAEAVSFASVLLKRKCMEDVGLLDESFRMYLEDVDFSIRCRKKGWKVLVAPKSRIFHHHRGTGTQKLSDSCSEVNRIRLLVKHHPEMLEQELDRLIIKNHSKIELDLQERLKKQGEDFKDHVQAAQKRMAELDREKEDLMKRINETEERMVETEERLNYEKILLEESLAEEKKVHGEESDRWMLEREVFEADARELSMMLDEASGELENMKAYAKQKEAQLDEIFKSRGWKFLTTVHKIKHIGRNKKKGSYDNMNKDKIDGEEGRT